MKKRDGDIASLFQKIAAKKNSLSSLIPSNDAMDHDRDIGPSDNRWLKNKLKNMMNDDLLDDCLIILIERDILLNVEEEDIINCFMVIRQRMPNMNKK
jgi:hypothetical protein